MRLDAEKHDVGLANRREVAGDLRPATAALRRGKLDLEVAVLCAQHAQTALLHRLEMRPAREQHDISAGPRQPRADVAANGTRPRDNYPHQAFDANACATMRRWILPVAVRGICSVMWICFGRLKSDSFSLQYAT